MVSDSSSCVILGLQTTFFNSCFGLILNNIYSKLSGLGENGFLFFHFLRLIVEHAIVSLANFIL